MRERAFSFVIALILLSQIQAFAKPTTISDIKGESIICFNVSKPEAFAIKTTEPQKIWKAQVDKEGKLKVKKAFELGEEKLNIDKEQNALTGFTANLTDNITYEAKFTTQEDGDILLTLITTTQSEKEKGSEINRFNCLHSGGN